MTKIYLIGFMGSGKSTIGRRLSERYNFSFIDLDDYIIQKENMEIKDIFSKYGEDYFRNLETKWLKKANAAVIATGGGIVEREQNISYMNKTGTVIYLDVSFSEIKSRLHNDTKRPLWSDEEEKVKQLYNSRLMKYKRAADFSIRASKKTPLQIVDEILKLVVK